MANPSEQLELFHIDLSAPSGKPNSKRTPGANRPARARSSSRPRRARTVPRWPAPAALAAVLESLPDRLLERMLENQAVEEVPAVLAAELVRLSGDRDKLSQIVDLDRQFREIMRRYPGGNGAPPHETVAALELERKSSKLSDELCALAWVVHVAWQFRDVSDAVMDAFLARPHRIN